MCPANPAPHGQDLEEPLQQPRHTDINKEVPTPGQSVIGDVQVSAVASGRGSGTLHSAGAVFSSLSSTLLAGRSPCTMLVGHQGTQCPGDLGMGLLVQNTLCRGLEGSCAPLKAAPEKEGRFSPRSDLSSPCWCPSPGAGPRFFSRPQENASLLPSDRAMASFTVGDQRSGAHPHPCGKGTGQKQAAWHKEGPRPRLRRGAVHGSHVGTGRKMVAGLLGLLPSNSSSWKPKN